MNNILQFAETASLYKSNAGTVSLETETTAAVMAVTILFMFFAVLLSYAISAFFIGRVFKKAGVASWIAWVPFYSSWKLLEMGGQSGFWAVLTIIPFVNYVSAVFLFIAMYHIGLKFEKSGPFVLFAIFLPIVWLIWLAVDKSTWNNALGAPSKAIEHNIPAQPIV